MHHVAVLWLTDLPGFPGGLLVQPLGGSLCYSRLKPKYCQLQKISEESEEVKEEVPMFCLP